MKIVPFDTERLQLLLLPVSFLLQCVMFPWAYYVGYHKYVCIIFLFHSNFILLGQYVQFLCNLYETFLLDTPYVYHGV